MLEPHTLEVPTVIVFQQSVRAWGESQDKPRSYEPTRPKRARECKRGQGGEVPRLKSPPDIDFSSDRLRKPNEIAIIPEILEELMSESHNNTENFRFPSHPDPFKKDISLESPDPSLAKYEVLISNLFGIITNCLVGDDINQSAEQWKKLDLRVRLSNEVY